jgi:hypothetical protein
VIAVTGEITQAVSGRRARAVVAAVAAVVLLGAGVAYAMRGTGSGTDPGSRPTAAGPTSATSSPAGSPSASPSETLRPPELPAAASEPTPKGAVAFFRYFWAVFNYSYGSLDSRPLRAISADSCKSCTGYIESIDDALRRGETFAGGKVTVTAAVAAPGDPHKGLVVNAVVTQEPAFSVTGGGITATTVPATQGQRIDAAIMWVAGRWAMRGMDSRSAG